MAGVVDDGQIGNTASQFDRNLPHGQVAVNLLVVAGETPVDGCQLRDARLVDALQGPYPQFEVRVHRVFHQHGGIGAPEGVGQVLHGEGVGRCSCSYPEDVDAIGQCLLHMGGCGHLGGHEHARLLLNPFEPRQRLQSVAFESARFGTRFPHAGAEHMATLLGQLPCRFHHLFLGFGRARSSYHERPFVVARKMERL